MEMAQDDELHKSSVKNVYLNHTQLSARGAHHKAKADKARLYTYRERRKLARLRPFFAGFRDEVDQDVCIFMEN